METNRKKTTYQKKKESLKR